VLLPEPDSPTIAVNFPAGKSILKLLRTWKSGLVGYTKLTFSKVISSREDTTGPLKPSVRGCGASIIENKMLAASAAREAAETGADIVPIDITIVIIEVRTLS
jgi:hypothetical protein